ncbi:helix-turn-helix domain-containing protein [Paenibacillus popilliae]|uniref:AraC family transcriptional regulator n=1 Tax=Paenibacillus popilliae TaxID=78057 RepID=A0ABY3ANC2_PAEPP|nr:helix-turn-helix domain-containing protein [Paenibacillus sp. SDF0028]TQR43984.1 AraC family transcriptional regulator [Paenibacillus sp. SDF0028]
MNAQPDNLGYFPHQPSFERKQMKYFDNRLSAYPKPMGIQYYTFSLDEASSHPMMILPDGSIDIMICCDQDRPSANVCGTVTSGKQGGFRQGNCDVFAIRFFPGYGSHVLRYPAHEFTDREIPLADVIRNSSILLEQIAAANNMPARIAIFESFYRQLIQEEDETPPWLKHVTEQIISSSGSRSMSDLSQHTGYSSRYIAKVFHEYVGMSPKLFSRIVRFQHVLDALLRSDYEGVMEEMMELGYYDQNHFIKEFKEFSTFTPKKYMEQL